MFVLDVSLSPRTAPFARQAMEVHLSCNFRPWGARYKLSDYSTLRPSSSSHLLGQNELILFFYFSAVSAKMRRGERAAIDTRCNSALLNRLILRIISWLKRYESAFDESFASSSTARTKNHVTNHAYLSLPPR